MVNFQDPQTIVRDFTALVNLHHVFTGIFMWEFFTTLDYEWDVFRGRRPYRWTIWVYSLARVAALLSMVAEIIGSDSTTQINCQAWGTSCLVIPNTAFAAASLLILLRIMAIWNREKIVILIAMGVWATDVVFLINGSVRVNISTMTILDLQGLFANRSIKPNIMGSLIADVVLLLIMLVGLLRLRFGAGDGFGLESTLWKQGLIWLLIAIVCEIPPTVFIFLNLNEPMSYIFQPLNTITMTIAATRMYRSLMDLGSSEISQESLRNSGRTVSKVRVRSEPIPLNRMESVRTEMDQSSKSQMVGSSSHISTDSYGNHEVDVKSDPEK